MDFLASLMTLLVKLAFCISRRLLEAIGVAITPILNFFEEGKHAVTSEGIIVLAQQHFEVGNQTGWQAGYKKGRKDAYQQAKADQLYQLLFITLPVMFVCIAVIFHAGFATSILDLQEEWPMLVWGRGQSAARGAPVKVAASKNAMQNTKTTGSDEGESNETTFPLTSVKTAPLPTKTSQKPVATRESITKFALLQYWAKEESMSQSQQDCREMIWNELQDLKETGDMVDSQGQGPTESEDKVDCQTNGFGEVEVGDKDAGRSELYIEDVFPEDGRGKSCQASWLVADEVDDDDDNDNNDGWEKL